jgi:excisionase family DNA binding protein
MTGRPPSSSPPNLWPEDYEPEPPRDLDQRAVEVIEVPVADPALARLESKLDALEAGANKQPKELLTADELAVRLDVVADTIRKWVSRDGCPCVRAGRKLRFREDAVIAWLETRRR